MVNQTAHLIITSEVERYARVKTEELSRETGISDLPISDNTISYGDIGAGVYFIEMRVQDSVCRGVTEDLRDIESVIEACLSGKEGSFQPPHILITQPQQDRK